MYSVYGTAQEITDWGKRVFNGPDGIAEASREATIYGNACATGW